MTKYRIRKRYNLTPDLHKEIFYVIQKECQKLFGGYQWKTYAVPFYDFEGVKEFKTSQEAEYYLERFKKLNRKPCHYWLKVKSK